MPGTCENCGSKMYHHGCTNCNEEAYIMDQYEELQADGVDCWPSQEFEERARKQQADHQKSEGEKGS